MCRKCNANQCVLRCIPQKFWFRGHPGHRANKSPSWVLIVLTSLVYKRPMYLIFIRTVWLFFTLTFHAPSPQTHLSSTFLCPARIHAHQVTRRTLGDAAAWPAWALRGATADTAATGELASDISFSEQAKVETGKDLLQNCCWLKVYVVFFFPLSQDSEPGADRPVPEKQMWSAHVRAGRGGDADPIPLWRKGGETRQVTWKHVE